MHDGAAVGDTLVLVGESGIGFSDNNAEWRLVENQPFTKPVIGVASGLDFEGVPILIAIDTEKAFSTSRNGKDWTTAEKVEGDCDFSDISYYNRTFVVACSNGPVLRSAWNGGRLEFLEQEDGPEFTRGLTRIRGGNGKWVGVGGGGMIRESVDASHFTPVASPTAKNLYAICHGKAKFAAGGEGGELIVTDENGDWKTGVKPFASTADIMALAYIDAIGVFLVTNRDGGVAASDDLVTWSNLPSVTTAAIRAVVSGGNLIVLGDDLGEIASSRKLMNLPWLSGNNSGNAKLVRIIGYDSAGMGIGQLVNKQGDATGDVLRDLVVLQPGTLKLESIKVQI
ncbi:MAG TPA: hypothetical protein DEB39_04185 [Planctomycetaceae bacterium]|nr:hypothetical protein [Planctomycetaceae bacterium]